MARDISKGIVIVNEFTIHGSRGNSPGRYVVEYMARDGASENLTPTTARPERIQAMERELRETYRRDAGLAGMPLTDYVTRYMARDTATEIAELRGEPSTKGLREDFDKLQGYAGVAFGPRSLSLSHQDVLEYARTIQQEYEKGKPVMKTVISFDTDYLKEAGVLPDDLQIRRRGDLYGKSDQAKLRLAIQHGLKNIEPQFSDLDYIGMIQVDTMHLHCHLAMVDKGVGKRFTKDGEQKGMLDDAMMLAMRRGIDNSLEMSMQIKPMSIQMEGERRNTISFIKRFTHKLMEERGLPQYLLACLPKDDRSLWKASINADGGKDNVMEIRKGKTVKKVHGNMKKANEIVRNYVVDLLNRPDSGFSEAMAAKHGYLMAQLQRGDFDDYYTYRPKGFGKNRKSVRVKLTPEEAVRDQEAKFREDVTVRGMNAVYDVLKGVDDDTIKLHTPLLDAMGMPYEEMAAYIKDDKMIEFGFRLRSYSNRLDYHRDRHAKVSAAVHLYEDGEQSKYNPESRALYDFLKIEQDYNHALMDKYRTFLHFYHVKDEYQDGLDEVMGLRHRSYARHAMQKDKSLTRSKDPEKVEQKGREEYGLDGASFLVTNPEMFQQRMDAEDLEYTRALRNFRDGLAGIGMLFDEDKGSVTQGLVHDFDKVKAYDLHHMSYDYTYDFKIASENVDNFVEMANKRYDAWQKAAAYLMATGQDDALDGIVSSADIQAAKDLADEYRREGPTYHTKYDDAAQLRRNTATIRLDHEIYSELSDRSMLQNLRSIMDELGRPEEPEASDGGRGITDNS